MLSTIDMLVVREQEYTPKTDISTITVIIKKLKFITNTDAKSVAEVFRCEYIEDLVKEAITKVFNMGFYAAKNRNTDFSVTVIEKFNERMIYRGILDETLGKHLI